jgi:hypothetical protein
MTPPVVLLTQPAPALPATAILTREANTSTPAPDLSATHAASASTAIVEAVVTTRQPRLYATYLSPDEKWLAEISIYDCVKINSGASADANAYEQLKIYEAGSEKTRLADSQLQYCEGLGAFGLEGLFWSLNNRYFYYTNAREGGPDGCGAAWQKPYLRLEISTLAVEELGGGVLSPDGAKLATWQGTELVIWDVNEGNELGRISPNVVNTETGTGALAWSPDSQALVYVQPESYCPLSGRSVVVRVDLPALEQTVLLESESPTFGSARWDTAGELILSDESGAKWVYAFETGDLQPLP